MPEQNPHHLALKRAAVEAATRFCFDRCQIRDLVDACLAQPTNAKAAYLALAIAGMLDDTSEQAFRLALAERLEP